MLVMLAEGRPGDFGDFGPRVLRKSVTQLIHRQQMGRVIRIMDISHFDIALGAAASSSGRIFCGTGPRVVTLVSAVPLSF